MSGLGDFGGCRGLDKVLSLAPGEREIGNQSQFSMYPNGWVILIWMASANIGEARFIVPSNDHMPMHVHVIIGDSQFILNLLTDGDVELSARADARRPRNAKKTDERRAINLAKANHPYLMKMCQDVHSLRNNLKENPNEPKS